MTVLSAISFLRLRHRGIGELSALQGHLAQTREGNYTINEEGQKEVEYRSNFIGVIGRCEARSGTPSSLQKNLCGGQHSKST